MARSGGSLLVSGLLGASWAACPLGLSPFPSRFEFFNYGVARGGFEWCRDVVCKRFIMKWVICFMNAGFDVIRSFDRKGVRSVSTGLPRGNQVDGLPRAPSRWSCYSPRPSRNVAPSFGCSFVPD